MAASFRWFILLAGMRTGSNLLETQLNAAKGITCHGEAFNPHFVGYPDRKSLFGVDLARRDSAPGELLDRMLAEPGLNGFRFFPDHDPRVLDRALRDPACAKILLSRPPLDSYLSLLTARATGQWKLGNLKNRKSAGITFRPDGFLDFLDERDGFHAEVMRVLRHTGQTAFHLGYADLGDLDSVNGLLAYLGVPPMEGMAEGPVRQNPEGYGTTLTNPGEMEAALRKIDWTGRDVPPTAETRRGPRVPSFVAAAGAPILYLPVPGVPDAWVKTWLGDVGSGGGTTDGFTQKTLRQWLRDEVRHRSFTVVRHPLSRAWDAFGRSLAGDIGPALAGTLSRTFGVPAFAGAPSSLAPAERRRALLGFLAFLRANLAGQTGLRTTPLWASQTAHLAGFAGFLVPDMVCRAATIATDLAHLSASAGCAAAGPAAPGPSDGASALAEVYDGDVETAARAVYGRDYAAFGYGDWTPQAA